MIKAEVLVSKIAWKKYITSPNNYLNKKLQKAEKKIAILKKNKLNFTLLLSGDSEIKKLNKKFRNKDIPTDVLSFPSEKKIDIKKIHYLGDIIISYEFMNKSKTLSNLEFKDNVTKVFIHGFLHLLGYDHIKLKDFKKMLSEEKKIYKIVKIESTRVV